MYAAFELAAGPTAGAGVAGIGGESGARFAANAGIASLIERQQRDVMLAGEIPDVFVGPLSQKTHFGESLAGWERESVEDLQVSASGRLDAAETSEPHIVVLESIEQRTNFTELAALVGLGLIQDAELRFLLGNGLFRHYVDEIEAITGGHGVAVSIDFGEVVTGFKEKNGNVGKALTNEMEDDHIFGLEATGEADGGLACNSLADIGAGGAGFGERGVH
jgi:hypothetical protein